MVIVEQGQVPHNPEIRHIKREMPGKTPVRFDGPLGYPGMSYTTPEGEHKQAVAVFNAGMETIAHPSQPGKMVHLAIARAKSDVHVEGKPDANRYLFAYTFDAREDGFFWSWPQVIDTNTLKTQGQLAKGLNLEDLRLTAIESGIVAGMTVVGDDGVPKVAVAKASLTEEKGGVGVTFTQDKTHSITTRDGELEGKNTVMRIAPDGSWVVMYRPEFAEGLDQHGYRNVNTDTFKFVKIDPQNLDKEAVAISHRDMVLPRVDGVVRWGWNGGNGKHNIALSDGSHLELVHYIEEVKKGEKIIKQYGFRWGVFHDNADGTISCGGIITKPFYTYDDQKALTPDLMHELNREKEVIYSPGSIMDNGRFVVSVTVGDTGFGLVSWDIEDILQFAREAIGRGEFVQSPTAFPLRRRTDKAA